jgi:hypothetical protein
MWRRPSRSTFCASDWGVYQCVGLQCQLLVNRQTLEPALVSFQWYPVDLVSLRAQYVLDTVFQLPPTLRRCNFIPQ